MSSQRQAVGQRTITQGLFLDPAEWLGNLKNHSLSTEEGIMSWGFEFKLRWFSKLYFH
jgi:hypothetical protein